MADARRNRFRHHLQSNTAHRRPFDDPVQVPLLRRLWFESYSATVVEIKQRVSGLEAASRKLTQPELVARRWATQTKLCGLRLEGELDVSDDLVNAFAGMTATQTIKYVGLEKATKRELGIEGITTDLHVVKEGAFLKEIPAPTATNADVSTELRVELSLQRLGLAAAMGGVLSFAKHEDLRLTLQRAALVVPPSGYARISLEQTRCAHKEFWNQMSVRAEGRLAAVGGVKPLDALLDKVFASRQFMAHLMYLPTPAAHKQSASSSFASGGPPNVPASKRFSKAEKKRKHIEQAAELAITDERAKMQKVQKPPQGQHKGASPDGFGGSWVRFVDSTWVRSG